MAKGVTSTKESLRALFNKNQKEQITKANEQTFDPRFLTLRKGQKIRCRLLFSPTDERTTPFIEQKIHKFYNPNFKKTTKVVCPSSEYLEGYAGYGMCPICAMSSKAYEKYQQTGDKAAKALYDKCKRGTVGYAVVYVVSDSDENSKQVGKCKIFRYTFNEQEFFDLNVTGKPVKGKPALDPDEVIGFDAFDLDEGCDLLISVGEKKVGSVTYPDLTLKFSNKKTSVDLDMDDLPAIFKELKFDEDFYVNWSKESLDNFYNQYIVGNGAAPLDVDEEDDDEDEDDDIPFETPAPKKAKLDIEEEEVPDPKPAKKAAKKVVEEEPEDDFSDFEEDDEEEEEEPVKSAKKSTPAKKSKKVEEPEPPAEDDDDDFSDFDFEEDE